jgi:hypothetical protein
VDAIIGFNLGLSCSDYDWPAALGAMQDRAAANDEAPVPMLLTANSRAEAEAELELLGDIGLLAVDKEWLQGGKSKEDPVGFLQRNPLGWLRPLQSGSMGNDVYLKSCWLFGGNLLRRAPEADSSDSEMDEGEMREAKWAGQRNARQRRKDKRLAKRARRSRV